MKSNIAIGLLTLIMGFFLSQVIGCLEKRNVKEVLGQHPCPPPKPIDPDIIRLAWIKGTTAGLTMADEMLFNDNLTSDELDKVYWPIDSVTIQNCIQNGH